MNTTTISADKLFRLGDLRITPGARDELNKTGESPMRFIRRHQSGDWSEMSADDQAANAEAVIYRNRVFSAYYLKNQVKIWIITEADRSATTVLLPEEY